MIVRPGPLFRSPAQGVTAFGEGEVITIRSAQIINYIFECVPEETKEGPYLWKKRTQQNKNFVAFDADI